MARWCTAATAAPEMTTKRTLYQKIVAFYTNGITKHVFTFYFNIVIVIMVMKVRIWYDKSRMFI